MTAPLFVARNQEPSILAAWLISHYPLSNRLHRRDKFSSTTTEKLGNVVRYRL